MTFTRIGQTGQTLAAGNQLEDGTKRGAIVSATKPQDSSRIAMWLADQTPADMDKAAVSRASSRGVGLRVRYESRFPRDENGNRLPSYSIAVACDMTGTPEAAQSALDDLRNFMTPAPMRKIEEWIARVSVVTAKRRDDEFGEELRVVEYSSRLSRYPADVVKNALLMATYKFFPTWDELERRCEAMTAPRRCMIAALERGPVSKEEERQAATMEERERIQALVDRAFPHIAPERRQEAADAVAKANDMRSEE